MAALSERERVMVLIMRGWGDLQRSYNTVTQLFNEHFRDDNNAISKSTVVRTIQRFENSGSVKNLPRSGRPKTATNEEKAVNVLQSFVENPHVSINRVAQEHEICHGSVHNILKVNKYHPYKVHLTQELSEDDFDRRVEFCDIMMDMIVGDNRILNNVVFSDEATFELSGNLNRHNCRYWSSENPHWRSDGHTQFKKKVNVWAGILNGRAVGPFFIENNLNANVYEVMLREQIVPSIREIAGDNMDEIYFQHDGAPPHYGVNVRQYLNEIFPDRWIGRRGPIEWPPRSPDLTPLDFFLWGYIKNKVYVTQPQNLNDLRQRITDEMRLIPREMYQNAVLSVYNRLAHCQAVAGQQFEHLL